MVFVYLQQGAQWVENFYEGEFMFDCLFKGRIESEFAEFPGSGEFIFSCTCVFVRYS